MTKTNLLIVGLIIASVTLSCAFFKGGSGNSTYGIGENDKLAPPPLDPKAAFPAMSTDAINALIKEVPELSNHREKILDLERAAIKGLVANDRPKTRAGTVNLDVSKYASIGRERKSRIDEGFIRSINLVPAAYAADDAPSVPDMGGIEFFLVGYQVGFFTPDFEKARDEDRGKSKTNETKNDDGTVLASQTVSVNSDGTISAEMTTSINMPVLGLNANSKVKITGNQCPAADGKIELTIEMGSNGRAGSSGSAIYDKTLSGKIIATVNDDAELAGFDLDIKQATRSTAGGRQVYIESSQAVRSTDGTYSGMNFSDPKIERASSQATADDATQSSKGLLNAFLLAQGILENAKGRWQGGGCVKIDAASPGSVDINSTHQIPVKVVSNVDRTEVPSKLEAKLTGGATVDPTVIPKTAGTLTYTAPGESGKSATIKLTANSRRGRATLDLTASTGSNSYRVNGTSSGVSVNGEICSLGKPFFFNAKFPGGTGKIQFNPAGAAGGTLTESGGGSGCTYSGSGDYSVSLKDDGSGTITWTTTAKLSCPMGFSNTRTVNFSLPLIPALDLKCN